MRRLVSLDLSSNPLDDAGVSVLAAAPSASGLVDLGLCDTALGDRGFAALAETTNMPGLRSLDVRGHHSSFHRTPTGYELGGVADLARSPLLGQLRRLLINWSSGPSNGWTADVLTVGRKPPPPAHVQDWWISDQLRKSSYLIPSLLVDCDLADLWWLGDTRNRERLPNEWSV
ncbi:MAG TPA: hypothetical protein VKD90_07800 [Gemmataceae bacterium]|nr:hypothetical protein [Gemmataceae bacterium]